MWLHRVKNMVSNGLLTYETKTGVCGIFATTVQKTGQKLAYPTKYLTKHWSDLPCIFSIARHVNGDY